MVSGMMELIALRKNKICLSDYDYQKDIENRLLMAQFSALDIELLEEILYSSIQIPIRTLSKRLEVEEKKLLPSLERLSKTGLFTFADDTIIVDKETRKYFESQILKFDEDFIPGMDFLQNLLRKVPIHVLPVWYSIPRTSNNIFDSLIEKYLLTPQIFQRYLMELNLGDNVLKGIIDDVYESEDLEVSSKELIEKYQLSKEQFEEHLLHLEFNFVCCLGYRKEGDQWEEKVTPFHEWKEYLSFIKRTEVPSIKNADKIQKKRPNDYSFVQDLTIILEKAKKQPIPVEVLEDGRIVLQSKALQALLPSFEDLQLTGPDLEKYIQNLIAKLRLLKLGDVIDKRLHVLDLAHDWLDMRNESKAMFFYRHPMNRLLNENLSAALCTEKCMRETERSVGRALHKNWVFFDEFIKGVHVPLTEDSVVMLKRFGKSWKYATPEYTPAERDFIKAIVCEWLFEAGLVQVGTLDGKDCFCVTSLGHSLFGR